MAPDGEMSLPLPPGWRWAGPLPVPDLGGDNGVDARADALDLAELKAKETCPICRRLLDGIAMLDEPDRSQALVEYGRFKAAMEGDRATEADIKRVFETSPTLEHVLIDKLGVEELGIEIEDG